MGDRRGYMPVRDCVDMRMDCIFCRQPDIADKGGERFMNIPTVIVLILIAAALAAAVIHMIKNRNSCGSCGGCSSYERCSRCKKLK